MEWEATTEERKKISAICDRAIKGNIKQSKLDLSMDIEATHCNGCFLDLDKLLNSKDSDFFHDICGIIECINRGTGELKDCFLPRCSRGENHEEITGDEFHEILKKIIEEKVSVDNLLSMPDIYEILSEEYNNEVLKTWEQEQGQDSPKEELFSFDLHERIGEKEYSWPYLVKAKNIEEASKKANEYCIDWYPADTTYQYNKRDKIHIFDAGTRYITVVNLQKVEKKDWIQNTYQSALIG